MFTSCKIVENAYSSMTAKDDVDGHIKDKRILISLYKWFTKKVLKMQTKNIYTFKFYRSSGWSRF